MKTKYKKPDWAVDQITRGSGLVEDVCEHGVGHPNIEWLEAYKDHPQIEAFGVHGCDGCCGIKTEPEVKLKECFCKHPDARPGEVFVGNFNKPFGGKLETLRWGNLVFNMDGELQPDNSSLLRPSFISIEEHKEVYKKEHICEGWCNCPTIQAKAENLWGGSPFDGLYQRRYRLNDNPCVAT